MEPVTAGWREASPPLTRVSNRAAPPAGGFSARLVLLLGLAAVYFLAARAGLQLASVAEQVTVVWPPSGIALAAVLLAGRRVWPAIWAGAFLANLTAHAGIAGSLLIASGNTAEALAAAWLLKSAGFDMALERLRDVVWLALLGAGASTALAATVGAVALCATGVQPWTAIGPVWRDWWLGDAMGDLLVAPALLTLCNVVRDRAWPPRRLAEGALLLALLLGLPAFALRFSHTELPFPSLYVVFPILIWAGFRFGQPGTSLAVLLSSAAAVWMTIAGYGPFAFATEGAAGLGRLQWFLGTLCTTALLVGASIAERDASVRRREAERGVTRALAGAETLEAASLSILEVIGTTLGWDVGGLWRVDEKTNRLRPIVLWKAGGVRAEAFLDATRSLSFESGVGLPGRVWWTGRPLWVEDVLADDNFPRGPFAARDGLRGAVGFPILYERRVIGVADFFSRRIRRPDEDLLAMFASLGSEIGQYVGRLDAEIALGERETQLQGILDSALDCVITMDGEGVVREFNPAAEATFGWRREEAIGRPLAELVIPPETRERHTSGLKSYLRTGRSTLLGRRLEMEALRRDGSRILVELSITTSRSKGHPLFTGFLRDVTARRRAEEERVELLRAEREAKSEADAANRAKDEFLAILSHELRTPLNAILGWAHLLSKGLDAATAARARETIIRNVKVQQSLIEDLLDVSRIIRGQIVLELQPLEPSAWLVPALESALPLARAKGVSVHADPETSCGRVLGDARRLQQVVTNLVGNAVKFTPSGGTVTIALMAVDGWAELSVHDTGKGIAPKDLPLIFDPFRQADSSSRREHSGLGLGLAIVQHIVRMHGGTVRAESEGEGLGATLSVRLPLLAEETHPADAASGRRSAAEGETERRLAGIRILAVEDDDDSREVILAILEQAGAEVVVADSVDAALAALTRGRPQVILTDIEMPGRDGYDLARTLRGSADPALAEIPIIALTAYAHPADRLRTREEGFTFHLAKPIEPRRIEAAILRVLDAAPHGRDKG